MVRAVYLEGFDDSESWRQHGASTGSASAFTYPDGVDSNGSAIQATLASNNTYHYFTVGLCEDAYGTSVASYVDAPTFERWVPHSLGFHVGPATTWINSAYLAIFGNPSYTGISHVFFLNFATGPDSIRLAAGTELAADVVLVDSENVSEGSGTNINRFRLLDVDPTAWNHIEVLWNEVWDDNASVVTLHLTVKVNSSWMYVTKTAANTNYFPPPGPVDRLSHWMSAATIAPRGGSYLSKYDNVYLLEGMADATPDSLQGPLVVQRLAPVGDGASTDWTGDYTDIEDVPVDVDKYIRANDFGQVSTFDYSGQLWYPAQQVKGMMLETHARSQVGLQDIAVLRDGSTVGTQTLTRFKRRFTPETTPLPGNVTETQEFGVGT